MKSNCSPKISIIVPVYKAEQYLSQCIESILLQKFDDFELLLIDDGSPDNSGKICDDYALKDKRVRVFHRENGGVSVARNVGLENAQGKWIGFVDSDDWTAPNMYELLYASTQVNDSVDIVSCNYREYMDGVGFTVSGFIPKQGILLKEDICWKVLKPLIYSKDKKRIFKGYLWRCIYRKSLIEREKIRFANVGLAEDALFNLEIMSKARGLYVIKEELYFYRKTNISLSATFGKKKLVFENFLALNKLLTNALKREDLDVFLEKEVANWRVMSVISGLRDFACDFEVNNYKIFAKKLEDDFTQCCLKNAYISELSLHHKIELLIFRLKQPLLIWVLIFFDYKIRNFVFKTRKFFLNLLPKKQ